MKQQVDLVTKHHIPVEFAEKQLHHFWLPNEPKVEKDVQSIMVDMTAAERHGLITTLKLFTHYELKAGEDYWLGRYMRMFPRHEFTRMASTFGMTELAIHKPFYSRINEVLGLATDEFYNDYVNDPVLVERMTMIDEIVNHEDDAVSLGAFTFIEGAVLYASFAYLKHFQANGKNKALNIVRGINFSLRDENLHAEASAWSHREKVRHLSEDKKAHIEAVIKNIAYKVCEHEFHIVDMIFSKGDIEGITAQQMREFVMHRVNHCLSMLGYSSIFSVTDNTIKEWFYDSSNKLQFNDKFTGIGSSYHRDWSATDFQWSSYGE